MQFLCLAYGDERDWVALSKEEQDELLAQDEVLRRRGDLVAAVGEAVTVRAWDGTPSRTAGPAQPGDLPLAGFSGDRGPRPGRGDRAHEGHPVRPRAGRGRAAPLLD